MKNIVNSSNSVFGDLGVDGSDAYDLLDAFATHFKVDLRYFRMSDYFGPEQSGSLLGCMLSVLRRNDNTPEESAGLRKLLISDLVKAAKDGQFPGIDS